MMFAELGGETRVQVPCWTRAWYSSAIASCQAECLMACKKWAGSFTGKVSTFSTIVIQTRTLGLNISFLDLVVIGCWGTDTTGIEDVVFWTSKELKEWEEDGWEDMDCVIGETGGISIEKGIWIWIFCVGSVW